MLFVQGFVAETKTIHHTRPEILHQYVRLADQPAQDLRPASRLQIEHDATLVAVHHHKGGGFVSDFCGTMCLVSSPFGVFSILMTSAPISASMSVQVGPAMTWVRSTIFNPASGPIGRPSMLVKRAFTYSPAHCGWRLLRKASNPSRKSRLM